MFEKFRSKYFILIDFVPYTGFSRDDVTSKCYGCEVGHISSYIMSGNKANRVEKFEKKNLCSACKISNNCSVISELQVHQNENLSPNTLDIYEQKADRSSNMISNKNTLVNAEKNLKMVPDNNQKEISNNCDRENNCDGDDKDDNGYWGAILLTTAILIIAFMVINK